MDLQIIKVTMQEDEACRKEFLESGGQCEDKPYVRTIELENNEEGRFRRLSTEL
jgi:hypothetical protein